MDYGLLNLGILLGLGAAAPIGPVNVEIARRTLRGGFRHGFALGCGAVSVDVLYAILSSQGLGRVLDHKAVFWTLAAGGVTLLVYLATLCFRAAWRALKTDPIDSPAGGDPEPLLRESARAAYAAGVLMTLLNPMTLAFWFVAVPGTLGPITRDAGGQLPAVCAGVFVGTLAWVVGFTGVVALAGRYRKPWWLAAADLAGGVTLLAFAGVALWRLARPFL